MTDILIGIWLGFITGIISAHFRFQERIRKVQRREDNVACMEELHKKLLKQQQ